MQESRSEVSSSLWKYKTSGSNYALVRFAVGFTLTWFQSFFQISNKFKTQLSFVNIYRKKNEKEKLPKIIHYRVFAFWTQMKKWIQIIEQSEIKKTKCSENTLLCASY